MRFYLVGIKGAGMTALANILLDLNYEVKGCDYPKTFFTDALLMRVKIDNIDDFVFNKDYYYIIGNAFVKSEAAAVILTNTNNYQYYPRFLATFFPSLPVCCAGSHGKTTTVYFTSQLVKEPLTTLCGDGYGKGVSNSKYFLYEACEYKDTFLNYNPYIGLITNIDYDHPDFFKSLAHYIDSFQKFADRCSILLINGDDLNCLNITHRQKITYGFNDNNDIKMHVKQIDNHSEITLTFYKSELSSSFTIPYIGNHFAYNFTAALLLAFLMNTKLSYLKDKAPQLMLPARRTNKYYVKNQIIIDDYAHHPTEIKATLEALKKDGVTLTVVYQPHTYSRTLAFKDNYINALLIADNIYILDVFSSVRESYQNINPLLQVDNFKHFSDHDFAFLSSIDRHIIVFMGAGDVNICLNKYLDYLKAN